MIYISPKDEYPRHYGDIQLEHPSWQLGDELPEGWREVAESPMPEINENQTFYEDFPVEINGVLTQNWQVRDLTAEEIEEMSAYKQAKDKFIALGVPESEVDNILKGLL